MFVREILFVFPLIISLDFSLFVVTAFSWLCASV